VARAAYDTSSSNLADTIIKAPVAGLVIGKPTPAGQTVAPGISTPMVLMTIADMSIMQSETLVDESDIGQVALGQKVDFTVDAYTSEVFEGVVSLISRKAETTNNVVYYKVYVDVLDNRQLLFPNMTSRATVYTAETKNVLTLPLSAVRETKEGHFAYRVLPNGATEEVQVTLGLRGDDRIEIKSGLNEGDAVALKAAAVVAPANRAGNMRAPRLF
jgi:HlyD family secretion protein